MNASAPIISHYAHPHLATEILHAVGKPRPSPEDLSPFDEFHIGGRMATKYLIDKLHIEPETNVLDIGCGIGGAARYVAETTKAYVTGVDLTPDYIRSAVALSDAVGLGDNTQFIVQDAMDLSFGTDSFNAAYTIFLQRRLYHTRLHEYRGQGWPLPGGPPRRETARAVRHL
jgi:SAM-dependent methyltransferase